jgi:hypothetical protein
LAETRERLERRKLLVGEASEKIQGKGQE